MVFSVNYVELQAWYVDRSVRVFGFWLPYIYLLGFALAVVLLGALYFMLYRTRFGMSVRASLADQTSAALVGINVKNVSTICFGIGIAVTAAGGMIYGATNAFNASSSYDLISRLLVIIVLGGMGSIGGALAAGVFMITVEDMVSVIWGPVWSCRFVRRESLASKRRGSLDVSFQARPVAPGARGIHCLPLDRDESRLDDDWNIHSDLYGVRDVVEHVFRLLGLRQPRLRSVLRIGCLHHGPPRQSPAHGGQR
jgi:hypothetical protein